MIKSGISQASMFTVNSDFAPRAKIVTKKDKKDR